MPVVGQRNVTNVSNLTVDDGDVTGWNNQSAFDDKTQNHQPIKVLATAKKAERGFDHPKNFDMSTPGGVQDSAMKPARLVSELSEFTGTPTD